MGIFENIALKSGVKLCRRPIETLRASFPGKWAYEGESTWIHESGRRVVGYAAIVYSNDDSTFVTEYRWEDTQELLWRGRIFHA